MAKDYQKALHQLNYMAEYVINDGREVLKDYRSAGDWHLFIINRKILDETELNQEDQKRLKKLDDGIANAFTPALLKEYADYEPRVREWWDKYGTIEKRTDIENAIYDLSQYRCIIDRYDFHDPFREKDPFSVRDKLQKELESNPDFFTTEDLNILKGSDLLVLGCIKYAAEWVRFIENKPTPPEIYWWYYLDEILEDIMEPPDLDEFFKPYFKKINEVSYE